MNKDIYVIIGIACFIYCIACFFKKGIIWPSRKEHRSWIGALMLGVITFLTIAFAGLLTIGIARLVKGSTWLSLALSSFGIGVICLMGYGWLFEFFRSDSNKQNTNSSTQKGVEHE